MRRRIFIFDHLTTSYIQMELQQSNLPQQRNELEIIIKKIYKFLITS